MKDIGNSIARTVALAVVLLGCALPCGAMGASRPTVAIDGLWGGQMLAVVSQLV